MISTAAGYLMTRRLFTVSETALGALRARTFRHIHDLSMLHQQSERRGSLVSRCAREYILNGQREKDDAANGSTQEYERPPALHDCPPA